MPKDLIYTVEYSKAMANAYGHWSHFSDLFGSPNSALYKPLGGKAVSVQSMTVKGARAVDRTQIDGKFTRNFDTDEQILKMRQDREWDTLVDPMDMQEDAIVTVANITATFNQFQKIPEMDAYAASTLAQAAERFGAVDSTTLTKDNILEIWDSYLAYMVNQRVPRDRIRAKMTPDVYKLLKEAAGITRFIDTGTGIRDVDRNVGKLDGVIIEEVPADIMKDAFDFAEGWSEAEGAKQINILLFDPLAIAAPVVYDVSMLSAPSAQSKGKYLYYERYYYDVYALNQRLPGIYANITGTQTIGKVSFTTAQGTSGKTVLNGLEILPNGQAYVAKVGASAETVNYGDKLTTGWTIATDGAEIAATAGNTVTVAVVNTTKGNAATAVGTAAAVVA